MMIREGHERPLLACSRALLDMDHLSNLVRPSPVDLVDHAAQGSVLLVRCTGKLVLLWSPVIMNGACVTQMLKVMDTIKQTQNTQQGMIDCY